MITLQQHADIGKAIDLLKSGSVVGLPTETVYGLAADVYSQNAINKIFETKKRPFFDPLIVHISHISQIKSVVSDFSDLPQFLATRFWPGALTMVLPKSSKISNLVTSGLETVGVRFPKHIIAQKIISGLGAPVAAPSANLFGKTSPTTAEHVRSEFGDKVFVVDGGACEVGLESTVIGFDENYQIVKIHRPGAITEKDLDSALKDFSRKVYVTYEESKVAPGHLKHHYMPTLPLVVLESEKLDIAKIAALLKIEKKSAVELILSQDPVIAARELYSKLRECSEKDVGFIYVQKLKLQQDDLWTAIWDRLNKASSLVL